MKAPKKEDFQIISIEILIMKHEKYMSLQSIDFEVIFCPYLGRQSLKCSNSANF